MRQARNSGSFFEKRDMMLTLVFLRFIGEKFEDSIEKLKSDFVVQVVDGHNTVKYQILLFMASVTVNQLLKLIQVV